MRHTSKRSRLAIVLVALAMLALGAAPASGQGSARAPGIDNWANAFSLGDPPQSPWYTNNTATATWEFGEPQSSCDAALGLNGPWNTIWFRYQPTQNWSITADTFGSNYDTILAVYSGNTLGGLTEVACNDDTGGPQSEVTFTAWAGTTYYFQIDGYGAGTGGNNQFNMWGIQLGGGAPGNDNWANAWWVGDPPQGPWSVSDTDLATWQTNEPQSSCDAAAGLNGPWNTIWYAYQPTQNWSITADTFGSNYDTILAVYTGNSLGGLTQVACNDDSSGTNKSEVTFTAWAGTTYYFQIDGYGPGSGGNSKFSMSGTQLGGGGYTCAGYTATIVGTNSADYILGTSGDDVIVGLGGNDIIIGRGGNDVICGGSGRDRLKGKSGHDELYGQGGRDRLWGNSGNDWLDGGGGYDRVKGGAGSNDWCRGEYRRTCETVF